MPQQDPIQILEKDHRRMRSLITKLKRTRGGAEERGALVEELSKAIREHTTIEEEIVYPALHEAMRGKKDEKLFYEATEAHHVIDLVLPELELEPRDSMTFLATVKVLSDLIFLHFEEEESSIFPKLQKALGREALDALGGSLRQRKEALTREAPPSKAAAVAPHNGKPKEERPKARPRREEKLDLNSAELDELVQLKGISEARARNLIDYRESHGAFHDWNEVLAVRGISRNLLQRIQEGAIIGH